MGGKGGEERDREVNRAYSRKRLNNGILIPLSKGLDEILERLRAASEESDGHVAVRRMGEDAGDAYCVERELRLAM